MAEPKTTALARNLRKRYTWAEKLLWSWLRDRRFSAYKFRRQHTFGPYILDFFCVEAFLDIELVDGVQHVRGKKVLVNPDLICVFVLLRDADVARGLQAHDGVERRERDAICETIWQALQRAPHPLPDYCRPMPAVSGGNQPRGAR